ncbi:hypothetical protein [Haematobacter genomosp. 1]|nr:hypothetical protein [Haematobacter genomosp. 1]
MVFHVFAFISQFERERIVERTKEGGGRTPVRTRRRTTSGAFV